MNKKTYYNTLAEMQVKDRMKAQESTFNAMDTVLVSLNLPSGINGIFDRKKKGADYEVKQALAEVEAYICSTKMPHYLQSDARQKAIDSVDPDIREKLTPLLERLPEDVTPEDLTTTEDGRIIFTDEYKKRTLQRECTFTLPDDVAADLPGFEKWLEATEELISKGYDMFSPAGIFSTLRLGKITNPAFVLLYAARKPKQK